MKKLIYLFPLLCALLVVGPIEAKKKKYPNGDYYEGEWKKGAPNGYGIMKYANGNIYEGNWLYGVPNGNGFMKYASGEEYVGNFLDGKRHGQGSLSSNSKKFESLIKKGEWKNDMFYTGFFVIDTELGQYKCEYKKGILYTSFKNANWEFKGAFSDKYLPLSGIITKGEYKISIERISGKYFGTLYFENGTKETEETPSPNDSRSFNDWVTSAFSKIVQTNIRNDKILAQERIEKIRNQEYEQQKAKAEAEQKAREEEIKWSKAATQIPYYVWDASTIRSIYENNPARFRTLTQYKYIIFNSTIMGIEESDEMEYNAIYQDYIRYKLYTVRLSGGVYLETTDANFVSNLYKGQKAYFVGYYTDKKSYGRTLFTFEMCASSHDGLIGLMKKSGISLDYFVKRINY